MSVRAASSNNTAEPNYDMLVSSMTCIAHNYFVFYSCIVTTHKPGSDTTVGNRSIILKFSYVSPRSIYGETSNEGKESASTYPCRSLSGSVQVNGIDGVVLVVIQITEDPSAERTAPPRSTHVQPGDVSHALIQQGERERLRKTPSSSSTTAWW